MAEPDGWPDCNFNGTPDLCEPDEDGDGVINDCDGDDDNDGIADSIDAQPLTPSPTFDDGVTSGTVLDVPPGTVFEIDDAPNPANGIRVVVVAGPDLTFDFDCSSVTVSQQSASTAIYTYGSLPIEVITGSTSAEFTIDGDTHVIAVVAPTTEDASAVVLLEEITDPSGEVEQIQITVPTDSEGSVTVDDEQIDPGQDVTVTNVAAVVGAITSNIDPVQIGAFVDASATFTDENLLDVHTAVWDWGDNTSDGGVVTEVDGSGTITGSHIYTEPDVYTLTLTVTDDDGNIGQSVFQFIVVFDPDGGFVTGGGRIDSPIGAYAPDPMLNGNAKFGFVSKYMNGANVPRGQTQFQFKVADLNFHSTEYEWLVVGGPHAKFKGSGTINGQGDYGFMLTATDAEVNGGGEVDAFLIKIWDAVTEEVIYDNQMGDSEDADATEAIEQGSIVIHSN